MCGIQQGTGRGSGCPAAKGQDPHLSPEEAAGLMREGTTGHKGISAPSGADAAFPLPAGLTLSHRFPKIPPSRLYRAGGWLEEESPFSSLRHCRLSAELVGNFSAAAFVGELRRGLAGGSWQGWGRGQLPAGEGRSSPLSAAPPGSPRAQDPAGCFKSSL